LRKCNKYVLLKWNIFRKNNCGQYGSYIALAAFIYFPPMLIIMFTKMWVPNVHVDGPLSWNMIAMIQERIYGGEYILNDNRICSINLL
jgi:hypothetical protein